MPVGVDAPVSGKTRHLLSSLTVVADYSAAWNPGNVTADTVATETFTVSGARPGDAVIWGFDFSAGISATFYVSAADTVTVALANPTASGIDAGSDTLKLAIVRFSSFF